MSWVSKREDDEESLDFNRDLAALAPLPISKRDIDATRLKIEIENLRRFEQVAEYLLKQAKAQITQLRVANENLRQQLSAAEQLRLEDMRRISKKVSEIEAKKDKQTQEQIRELRQKQTKQEAQIREQIRELSEKHTNQEEQMRNELDERTRKLGQIEAMLGEFQFTTFKEMLRKSGEPSLASKFDKVEGSKGKQPKVKTAKGRTFGTAVLPPDLKLD